MPAVALRRRLQRAELREARSGAEVSAAVHAARGDEVHPGAGGVHARAVRQRARHRQADRVRVRRARPAVGDRDGGLPERGARTASPATTASRSSRTPTATAAPTSSRSSPSTSTSRRASSFANGGVIVAQAPHILFLKDTERRRQGGRAPDPEHRLGHARHARRPSNLQYAPDNYIWGVGRLLRASTGEMNGKPMQFAQGAYRFKPDGSDFEFMTGSTNNTWGLGFSRDVRRVRLDGEQRSELLHGDPQPLLRRRRGAADARPARRAARAIRALAAFYARALR